MIIGLKGEKSKLDVLYKGLGLKQISPNSFEELEEAITSIDGNTVILGYNEIMVFENPTADLVEKRAKVLSAIKSCKKNIYLSLTKTDPSLDKLSLDLYVCTKMDTNDMKEIEEVFGFCNTDLPYSGKLSNDTYAVRLHSENRAVERTIDDIKKLINE